MRLPEIEHLCRTVVPGAGSIALENLGAGLTSRTFRAVRDGVAYTLKVAAEQSPDLGLDLAWEVRVLERAAAAALAPSLVYCDLSGAVLLSRWAEGRSWASHEVSAPANLRKIAELLRRVHALAVPTPARAVTPLQWIETYAEALSRRTSILSDSELRSAALTRARALAKLPGGAAVVCHSDLHAMNLIEEGDSLFLLDWEYAHVTDPLWDLAGWCANNDFEAELQRSLLTRYFGDAPNSDQWQRFRLLLALYDYVCLLWSQLFLGIRGEAHGLAQRARLLDARLRVAAHYAA